MSEPTDRDDQFECDDDELEDASQSPIDNPSSDTVLPSTEPADDANNMMSNTILSPGILFPERNDKGSSPNPNISTPRHPIPSHEPVDEVFPHGYARVCSPEPPRPQPRLETTELALPIRHKLPERRPFELRPTFGLTGPDVLKMAEDRLKQLQDEKDQKESVKAAIQLSKNSKRARRRSSSPAAPASKRPRRGSALSSALASFFCSKKRTPDQATVPRRRSLSLLDIEDVPYLDTMPQRTPLPDLKPVGGLSDGEELSSGPSGSPNDRGRSPMHPCVRRQGLPRPPIEPPSARSRRSHAPNQGPREDSPLPNPDESHQCQSVSSNMMNHAAKARSPLSRIITRPTHINLHIGRKQHKEVNYVLPANFDTGNIEPKSPSKTRMNQTKKRKKMNKEESENRKKRSRERCSSPSPTPEIEAERLVREQRRDIELLEQQLFQNHRIQRLRNDMAANAALVTRPELPEPTESMIGHSPISLDSRARSILEEAKRIPKYFPSYPHTLARFMRSIFFQPDGPYQSGPLSEPRTGESTWAPCKYCAPVPSLKTLHIKNLTKFDKQLDEPPSCSHQRKETK